MEDEVELPQVPAPDVEEQKDGTAMKTFTVKGYVKKSMTITRGNAGSTKLSLPPDWLGRKVIVILQD